MHACAATATAHYLDHLQERLLAIAGRPPVPLPMLEGTLFSSQSTASQKERAVLLLLHHPDPRADALLRRAAHRITSAGEPPPRHLLAIRLVQRHRNQARPGLNDGGSLAGKDSRLASSMAFKGFSMVGGRSKISASCVASSRVRSFAS